MKQLMKPSAILGVAAMMLASCNQAPKAVENKKAEPKTETKELKIAFVEVDSIMTQYEFCKEFTKVLEQREKHPTHHQSKRTSPEKCRQQFPTKIAAKCVHTRRSRARAGRLAKTRRRLGRAATTAGQRVPGRNRKIQHRTARLHSTLSCKIQQEQKIFYHFQQTRRQSAIHRQFLRHHQRSYSRFEQSLQAC